MLASIRRPVMLWIVGGPGTGRTTLARALLGDVDDYLRTTPLRWTVREADVETGEGGGECVAAGWYDGDRFDGGDRVGFDYVFDTLEAWHDFDPVPRLTIIEGKRVCTVEAVAMMLATAHVVHACVQLVAAASVADQRRRAIGVSMRRSVAKDQTTYAERVARKLPNRCVIYSGATSAADVAAEVRGVLAAA